MKRAPLVSAGILLVALAARCARTGSEHGGCNGNCDGGEPAGGGAGVETDGSNAGAASHDARAGEGGNGATADSAVDEAAEGDGGSPCGEAWTQVKVPGSCTIRVGNVAAWCSALPSWSSCGDGCMRAAIAPMPGVTQAFAAQAAAGYAEGRLLVRLSALIGTSWYAWLQDIDSNTVLAVMEVTGQGCGMAFTQSRSPKVWPVLADLKILAAHGPDATGGLAWQQTPLPIPGSLETVFDSYGTSGLWGITSDNGSVVVATSLGAGTWTVVEPSGASPSYESAARGGQVVYPRWDGTKYVLRSFAAGATTTLYSGTDNVANVALSDDTMAWVGVDGPYFTSGLYANVSLYWSPRAQKASDVVATSLSSLPFNSGFGELDAAGDFVATEGCVGKDFQLPTCRVVVVQRSTKQLFTIKPPANRAWNLLAIAPSEVLLAESDGVSGAIDSLVRLRTDSLAPWNSPLPPP